MTGPELHVDLDVLAANIAVVRERVAPAELMLVVKDDAYGHGVGPVVARAVADGVSWIGAFDVPTARRVRDATGADVRVFVWMLLTGEELDEALDLALDLGVGDAQLLEDVAAAAAARGVVASVHLKIDTGLHRNGIRPEEWDAAVARAAALERQGAIRVAGIWSHIAEASDAEDDASRAAFEDAVLRARDAGLDPRWRHLAASAASFGRSGFRYDLVRVGAFCYGIRSAGGPAARDLGIRPAAALVARVTRADEAGLRLGVGSLHGLPSTLTGASLRVDGEEHAIEAVGPDEILLRAGSTSNVPEEVAVFGPEPAHSATHLAERIDSIGEELLVRLSPLVPRRYRGRVEISR
jgi:alanine racemase